MQDNTITVSVDTLNDGTTNDELYTRHTEELNRTIYHGTGHLSAMRRLMQFIRSAAKPKGNNRGFDRSTVKFTTDLSVPNADGTGDIVLPIIAEAIFTVPVGATPAETLEARQRLIAVLDNDAVMADLNDTLEI